MRPRIVEASLDDPAIARMLATHYRAMHATGPEESCHVLSIGDMRDRELTLWAAWDDQGSAAASGPGPSATPELLAIGAIQNLGGRHGEIKSMHTAHHIRGQGVDAALLRHMLDVAQSGAFDRLSLETGAGEDFAPARRLYARHDFVECAPFDNYRPDPLSVFMTRLF